MQDISRFKCPFIEEIDIWSKADAFRSKYWPADTLPIDVESIIEKHLRLNIEPIPGLYNDCDVDAYLKGDLSGIVVDNRAFMDNKFANRLRFSYAHELGHLVLHKDFYSSFPIDTLEDFINFTLLVPEGDYRRIEYQANEFAGRLLVPRNQLISELSKCIEKVNESDLSKFLDKNPNAVLASISPTLCRPFGVSTHVIELRVAREHLWPPEKGFKEGGE